MRKELPHFSIGSAYGGSQDWCTDKMMYLGGCGALTACECFLYFDLYRGTHLYPYDKEHLTRADYVAFGNVMKPYLRPRWGGIDKLELFMEGAGGYLRDKKERSLTMAGLEGSRPASEARARVVEQIDAGYPIPYLNLHHRHPSMRDYEWHWFFLNGYESFEDRLMVKAVTYGGYRWLDFDLMWNTGHARRGGMILWRQEK